MSLPLTLILTLACFCVSSLSSRGTSDMERGENSDERRAWNMASAAVCRLLTVDDHVDVFDIRLDVIAGFAFVTTRLVSHDTYNVQVLFSVQWVCCREVQGVTGRRRSD